VLDVIDQLDLGPFLAAYRADGHGRAAYDPKMLLGVLLYAYCTGIRSSRHIERHCQENIAFRVLAANSTPPCGRHVTAKNADSRMLPRRAPRLRPGGPPSAPQGPNPGLRGRVPMGLVRPASPSR
jgi:hypothetical protein